MTTVVTQILTNLKTQAPRLINVPDGMELQEAGSFAADLASRGSIQHGFVGSDFTTLEGIEKCIQGGAIPGFSFYRIEPRMSTQHCYIVNDYNIARGYLQARGIGDAGISFIFKFQNRWMQKGMVATCGWTLRIFLQSNALIFGRI